jgi:amino-acid N-acetyltransferase
VTQDRVSAGEGRPVIRAATEADAEAIRELIHTAELNPRDLDWRRFLVADDGGAVVACAQVRVHGGGTRELASVAVTPGRQGAGIGRAIAEARIALEPARPLYLYAEAHNLPFWERFAFREVDDDEIPRDMRAMVRLVRTFLRGYSAVTGRALRIAVMRRDDP